MEKLKYGQFLLFPSFSLNKKRDSGKDKKFFEN